MVFHETVLGSLSFLGTSGILYGAGGIVGAILFFYIMHTYKDYWAESASSKEKSVENSGGFRRIRGLLRAFEKRMREEAKQASREKSAIKASEAQTTDESKRKGIKGLIQGIKGLKFTFRSEDYLTALTWRTLGITAAMKKVTRSLRDWSYKRRITEIAEEQEVGIFPNIMEELKGVINNSVIEATIRRYLYNFKTDLINYLQRVISTEQENKKLRDELLQNMDEGLKVMKECLQKARNRLNKFRSRERKSVKGFTKEINGFRSSIKSKIKALRSLEKNGAEPSVISSLSNTINLLQKQLSHAEQINNQLASTYNYIKQIIRQMRRLLKYIISNEKQMAQYENLMSKRESEIDKKLKQLSEILGSVEKIDELQNKNPFNLALILSRSIKLYLQAYIEILKDDLQFEKAVADLNLKNVVIAQQMEACDRLEKALTQSEEAVASGAQAITALLSGIFGNEQQVNEAEIVKLLQDSTKLLDYEGGVQGFMERIEKAIEYTSSNLNSQIQALMQKNEEITSKATAQVRFNSVYLGRLVATGYARMAEVDKNVMDNANAFGNELKRHDNDMANAYNAAMRLQRRAAPA